MGYNFISCDREQQFLMPPSLNEWLPRNHLARFVVEMVDVLDLSAFYARAEPSQRAGTGPAPSSATKDRSSISAAMTFAASSADR